MAEPPAGSKPKKDKKHKRDKKEKGSNKVSSCSTLLPAALYCNSSLGYLTLCAVCNAAVCFAKCCTTKRKI